MQRRAFCQFLHARDNAAVTVLLSEGVPEEVCAGLSPGGENVAQSEALLSKLGLTMDGGALYADICVSSDGVAAWTLFRPPPSVSRCHCGFLFPDERPASSRRLPFPSQAGASLRRSRPHCHPIYRRGFLTFAPAGGDRRSFRTFRPDQYDGDRPAGRAGDREDDKKIS